MMNININYVDVYMMQDLENTFKVFKDMYPRVKEIKHLENFGALLGVIIDQYAADHDIKTEEMTNKVFEDMYPRVKEIKRLENFGALLGVIIDQYAADHDIKTEEMTKILIGLVEAHKVINKNMGGMDKSIVSNDEEAEYEI